MSTRLEVLLYKGGGWISKAIQWQTRSPYSHAAVFIRQYPSGAWIIDSREGVGCRLRTPNAEDGKADRYQIEISLDEADQVIDFLRRQVGKPYDYTMVARFITRRQESRASTGKWFCSELVFAAFQHAGINLLERVEPWAVSPGLLAMSPLLKGPA